MPKFTWDKWDFDLDGEAYVIRKDVCPNREDIPDFIISRNCGVCADAGHAYKLATGIIMCQVSQKFMSDTETCVYDLLTPSAVKPLPSGMGSVNHMNWIFYNKSYRKQWQILRK